MIKQKNSCAQFLLLGKIIKKRATRSTCWVSSAGLWHILKRRRS